MGEYVAALDEFKPGEVYDPPGTKGLKPAAWNLELGFPSSEIWNWRSVMADRMTVGIFNGIPVWCNFELGSV
jgi:hypothetical protein